MPKRHSQHAGSQAALVSKLRLADTQAEDAVLWSLIHAAKHIVAEAAVSLLPYSNREKPSVRADLGRMKR